MATKKHHISKGSVLAALDIGSTKIACFIAQAVDDDGTVEIIGVGHQASDGMKAGAIMELDKTENAVRKAVHAAENMAANVIKGYPLQEVIINTPATHTKTHLSAVDVDVQGEEVTENDIKRAILKGQTEKLPEDHQWLHTIPVGYRLDGQSGIKDPKGMFGSHLTVEMNGISVDQTAFRNLSTCIERSHLDVTAACVSSYASGLSCLVQDEMDLGCTVVDMGGGTTQIAVFHSGKLIYADAIPVGGSHVTSDIARGLNTGLQDAERIKTLYGSAISSSSDDTEMIDVPMIGEDQHGIQHVERATMIGVIRPRLEETFEMIRAKLEDSGVKNILGRNVILTGGASQLPGMQDLAKNVLDKKIRLGRPISLTGIPDAANGPAFSTVTGLLTYVTERFDEQPEQLASQIEAGTVWEKVKLWLRENW